MSILNTKNNQEKATSTGAKKSTKIICLLALATGIVAMVLASQLSGAYETDAKEISCQKQYGEKYPIYCETTRELQESNYKESIEHILYHLNQDEAISQIEVIDEKTIYMAPSGYTIVTIVERAYTKEDGTKVVEYETPLKTLVDGEYVYSAPNGGLIKTMAQKKYIDSEGVERTEYVEPEVITLRPHIDYLYQTDDGKQQCRIIYIENSWVQIVPTLVEEQQTLTK